MASQDVGSDHLGGLHGGHEGPLCQDAIVCKWRFSSESPDPTNVSCHPGGRCLQGATPEIYTSNMFAPENGWLEDEISFRDDLFSGAWAVRGDIHSLKRSQQGLPPPQNMWFRQLWPFLFGFFLPLQGGLQLLING